jgi:hypothetical protein
MDARDERFRILRGTAIVDQDMCPSLRECCAVARPIPRDAPVTNAVFP